MRCLRQRSLFFLYALLFVLSALSFSLNAQTVIDLGTGKVRGKSVDDYREEQGIAERARQDSLAYIDHLTRALNALHEDSLSLAEMLFLKALKTRPEAQTNVIVRYNLGRIRLAQGDYRTAIGYFDDVLHIRPSSIETRYDRAVCYYEMGNFTAALADCEALTTRQLDEVRLTQVRFLQAAAYAKSQQPDRAKIALEDILRRDPNNVSANLLLAGVLEDLGQPNAALNHLNLFIAAHPTDADGLVARAELQVRTGQTVAAQADYDAAIRLRPNEAELYVDRAKTFLSIGAKTAARRDLERAVALGLSRGSLNSLFRQAQ